MLARLLSSRADVLCVPESFFPGLLDWVTEEDWQNPAWMAALFHASCSDGSPLSLAEAQDCMLGGPQSSMAALARKVAEKDGRDPGRIRAVVWKSTRLVGSHRKTDALGWKYLILKRPELNVYESQFRVPFGAKNRDPRRFALFAASYEEAFRTLPAGKTRELNYGEIPRELDAVLAWMGSRAGVDVTDRPGILDKTAGQRPWHSAIGSDFRDDDEAKLSNLSDTQVRQFQRARGIFRRVGILPRLARARADRRQAEALREAARNLVETPET